MPRHHALSALCAVLAACALPVKAQIWGPRTLDELKSETQRRADRNLPPIAGIKPDDARAALAQINNLERETWAAAWSANGERYRAQAKSLEVGIHGYFQPEFQKKSFSTREYLFDIFPARATIYGVKTEEEYLAYGPKLSLHTRGLLDKPAAPTLLVNGEKDTQQPIADLYLMMKHGDPKEAWVNPAGGHMGRSAEWTSRDIFTKVVLPWIVRRLDVPQGTAVSAAGH